MPSSLTTLLPSALGFSPHPPVSVYGTGTYHAIAAFLGSVDSGTSLLLFRSASHFILVWRICLPDVTLCLHAAFHSAPSLSFCVPAVLIIGGTGISTSCPSTTTFVLALGPDLPRADEPSPGNLRLSMDRILTYLSLLTPAFLLLTAPQLLPVLLQRRCNAPLPIILDDSIASVVCFSPGHFRRKISRLVSYYALFECMAASKPTS